MSREKILNKIRQNSPASKLLPEDLPEKKITGTKDLKKIFIENLRQSGGEFIELKDVEEINGWLGEHYPSAVDFSRKESREIYSTSCPKEKLDSLETIILEAQFGVSENGAVWIDDSNFPNRLVPFITQQIIIKLDKDQLVYDMHEAYNRIDLNSIGFGLFISGPSKTADIEQSLVYGAHGAQKLVVVLKS